MWAQTMLWTSENAPRRAGYRYRISPGGGLIGYPEGRKPYINRKHIDGPLLYFSDGQLHWLSLWERVLLFLGRVDAVALEAKLRPDLHRG
jgi:hypothetical protein